MVQLAATRLTDIFRFSPNGGLYRRSGKYITAFEGIRWECRPVVFMDGGWQQSELSPTIHVSGSRLVDVVE